MIAPNDSSEAEFKRVLEVSQLDLDYQSLQEMFKNLTELASSITGAELSLVNILDSYWQWSIAASGMDTVVMRRENSVCQYTIGEKESLEVENFRDDDKFNVPLDEKYGYYFGVPLRTSEGNAIGALCIIDEVGYTLNKNQQQALKLIGAEIVEKLEGIKKMAEINRRFHDMHAAQRELGYDLRGPVSGVLGLSKLAEDEDDVSVLKQYLHLSGQSSTELLDIISDILEKNNNEFLEYAKASITITELKNKLLALYNGLAKSKNISLNIELLPGNHNLRFSRQKITQISGNLVSNAITYAKEASEIKVFIGLKNSGASDMAKLSVTVDDKTTFLKEEAIEDIMNSALKAKEGLVGEHTYGLGLKLVRHLVLEMGGQIDINSEEKTGTKFNVSIPRYI
ncbi:GAF domain-containing sensor histidine kinase [Zunongwangia atlantica]|uniref:Histidine kinase response regulator hybrid protein n=1 Tax=Zunongwangia atlantica 22II14-10F7 TaxID=1185767 RepID=A0A1Y1T6V0_9FLAO|nr:GAF domain-containing sensor histidine kinase [Zunongwangia atlantica]ORL46770.1 histidine kinase response regulator hybrid protein [Zunongwangia atlantica 22II14-10F7]